MLTVIQAANIEIAISILFLFIIGVFFYLDVKLHDLKERIEKLESKDRIEPTDNKDTEVK
jgi:hypothetical protein